MFHSWLILSVLTGFFFGLQSVLLKVLSERFEQTTILKYLFLIAGFLLLPLGLRNSHALHFRSFLPAFCLSLGLNLVAYSLLIRAIAKYPVSVVMPYVGLTPLFLTLSSFLILGEVITRVKFIGIVFIVLGAFVLQIPAQSAQLKGISRLINFKEKGIWYMIGVAFIWSITASVEKIAVQSSSPEFYGAAIYLSLGIGFYLLGLFRHKRKSVEWSFTLTPKIRGLLLLLGVVSAALALFQLTAIKLAFVTYVIAFKRAGVVISTLYGFWFLGEKNYAKVLSGTFFVLLGSGILTLA